MLKLEHWSCGHPIDRCCHIQNIPHSSDDKRRAILQWGTNITFFKILIGVTTCNIVVTQYWCYTLVFTIIKI